MVRYLGRYREIPAQGQRSGFTYGRGETYIGIERGKLLYVQVSQSA